MPCVNSIRLDKWCKGFCRWSILGRMLATAPESAAIARGTFLLSNSPGPANKRGFFFGVNVEDQGLLASLPSWLKYGGTALGGISATALAMWQWLSKAKVDRTADAATVSIIDTLQEQLATERKRSDELMRERDEMSSEIAQLRAEVVALRAQVLTLSELVRGRWESQK